MPRPKGSKNKATIETRHIFKLLLDDNAPKLQRWLDATAKKDPGRALELVIRMSEFVLPKMLRAAVMPWMPAEKPKEPEAPKPALPEWTTDELAAFARAKLEEDAVVESEASSSSAH